MLKIKWDPLYNQTMKKYKLLCMSLFVALFKVLLIIIYSSPLKNKTDKTKVDSFFVYLKNISQKNSL